MFSEIFKLKELSAKLGNDLSLIEFRYKVSFMENRPHIQ